MTLLTAFGITPTRRGNTVAPHELALSDLTMIVPVKNNQTGVTRLLEACLRDICPQSLPRGNLAGRQPLLSSSGGSNSPCLFLACPYPDLCKTRRCCRSHPWGTAGANPMALVPGQ